jgi:LPS export ABC transporter protein LptC
MILKTLLYRKINLSLLVTLLILTVSCNKEQPDKIEAIKNRAALPELQATETTTLISDSGITKYRITTLKCDVYDKAAQPYWNFPKGIHFEKFNLDMKVDADIRSNYARYNVYDQTWELKGKVRAMNLLGELFETEQLFWNQIQERFYTDSIVKITQKTGIINAKEFESNQSMTKYTFRFVNGPIILNDSGE